MKSHLSLKRQRWGTRLRPNLQLTFPLSITAKLGSATSIALGEWTCLHPSNPNPKARENGKACPCGTRRMMTVSEALRKQLKVLTGSEDTMVCSAISRTGDEQLWHWKVKETKNLSNG